MDANKHYIRLDDENNIIKGFSDAFKQPQPDDILINEQGGRHFELLGQVNPSLVDGRGVHLYKYVNGQIVVKTPDEINREAKS